ncbi:MAG: phage integrase N-terminal SAM-like domain-containing protein [Thermoguttaceae bacterium]|nr:phage integrase N-terminal SAM-like domain-containing protein [Thermoguttaceae bacterium]
MRGRYLSGRTEDAYVHWIRRYVEFHQHRHLRELSQDDVNRFTRRFSGRLTAAAELGRLPAVTTRKYRRERIDS